MECLVVAGPWVGLCMALVRRQGWHPVVLPARLLVVPGWAQPVWAE